MAQKEDHTCGRCGAQFSSTFPPAKPVRCSRCEGEYCRTRLSGMATATTLAAPDPMSVASVRAEEADMAEHLAAMRKIQDERTGSARRKEPLAIAAESPKSNGGGDMAEHLAAMRKVQDERKAEERRAKRLGVRTALTREGVLR